MRECTSLLYFESSGIVNAPFCIASVLSPKGIWKKHSLYSRHPSAFMAINFE